MPLMLLFVVTIPVLELWILIQIGGRIGAFPTVALLVLATLLGLHLLRHQGLSTMRRMQVKLQAGLPPERELLEGVVVMVSAILLLIPGFFTDVLALPGLLPWVRRPLVGRLLARGGALRRYQPGSRRASQAESVVVEGEYVRENTSSQPDHPQKKLP